jgi:hypothetical protein
MRRPPFNLLPIAWLLGLLLVPAIAWLLGARQGLLDNRPKTEWPHLSAHALRTGATYAQLDAALLERLPPRGRALDLHGQIAVNGFHDSPNPDVAIGSHGYRYFVPGLQTCRVPAGEPVSDPGDIVDVVARSLVAVGKQAMVLMPGDKFFIHPGDAPTVDADAQTCAGAMEREISQRLATAPGGYDVDGALKKLEAGGTPVFRPNDTHWNANGRLTWADAALDFLRPGLARQVGLHLGPSYERVGDMAQMLGLRTKDHERAIVPAHLPDPPVQPGSAVIIGDSQMEQTFTEPPGPGVQPLVSTVLPGTPTCTQPVLFAGGCDKALTGASKVIYETVGRNITQMEQICWRVLSLVTEASRITGPAARYERLDGGTPTSGDRLTIGPGGSVKLRVAVPGPDRTPEPRLLLLPLSHVPGNAAVTVTQQAEGGRPAPCVMAQQYDGGHVVLPVPAGRRASDMIVTLAGDPNAVVGVPRVVALDGRPAPRLKAAR